MSEHGPEHSEGGPPASEAFVPLFLAERRAIFEYILVLLPHPTDAEDVLQETATLLWQRFAEFTPGTSFLAWARQIAYYKVCEHRRLSSRQAVVLDDRILELVAADEASDEPHAEARRGDLRRCLAKLSLSDRHLMDRRYLDRTRGKDLAKEVGRPVDSIYKSLGRIRRTLLECIRRTMAHGDREKESL